MNEVGLRLARQFKEKSYLGVRVVGFFDDKLECQERLTGLDKPLIGRTDASPSASQNE